MPVSTINTNVGSYVALNNLRSVSLQLQATEKKISTGYVVADALDNGAVFGVAQQVRSQISGNEAANQELGSFIGTVQVAAAAATGISNTLSDIRAIMTHISNPTLDENSRAQYRVQFESLVDQMLNFINSGNYNGTNLMSDTDRSLPVIQDGSGTTLNVETSRFNMYSALNGLVTKAGAAVVAPLVPNKNYAQTLATSDYTNAASYLAAGGTFLSVSNSISTVLNRIGTLNSRATLQQTFNKTVTDSLAVGLGALVDADLAAESANLTAVQTKQQLATQSLSIANQNPSIYLKLFQ
ncbi:MAG: flagellin [Candidatus Pacebacteria bacterium]|nr:flagellin [Candidatus Paceibacterota bacterium]